MKVTEKRFNPDKAQVLMSDERKELLPPEKVIEYLELHSDDVVADLGAGNGYFTLPVAKRVSTFVYALDIEPKMLDMLKENAAKERVENIHYVISDLEKVKLYDNSVSKVLISLVMHEVPNVNVTLSEIKRILKPDGQLFLIEWEAIDSETGPPFHERIPAEKMAAILKEAGFNAEIVHLNPVNYAVKAVVKGKS